MSLKTKIKISDLRDRVTIDHITAYNSADTGAPLRAYTSGPTMWAQVRYRIISGEQADKTKVEQGYEVVIRRETHPIKIQDRVTWNTKVMYIRSMEDIDIYFIKLTCSNVY